MDTDRPTTNPRKTDPANPLESPMNAAPATAMNRIRKAAALVVALALATLAFGVGLPWIIVDAPPEVETLWAREIQSVAPAMSLSTLSVPRRFSGTITTR